LMDPASVMPLLSCASSAYFEHVHLPRSQPSLATTKAL
jgi:hypothetical protein